MGSWPLCGRRGGTKSAGGCGPSTLALWPSPKKLPNSTVRLATDQHIYLFNSQRRVIGIIIHIMLLLYLFPHSFQFQSKVLINILVSYSLLLMGWGGLPLVDLKYKLELIANLSQVLCDCLTWTVYTCSYTLRFVLQVSTVLLRSGSRSTITLETSLSF